jgi:hypothetical protein
MADSAGGDAGSSAARDLKPLLITVGALALLGLLLGTKLLRHDKPDSAEDHGNVIGPVTISYDVGGTATWGDVTIETPTGTEQFSPDIPMSNKHTGKRGLKLKFWPGDFVYISVQNNTTLGSVTCTIHASDGETISHSASSVDYGVATCDGTAR